MTGATVTVLPALAPLVQNTRPWIPKVLLLRQISMGDIRLRFLRESLSRHVNTDSVTHCQEAAVYITIRTLKLMVTFEILVEIRELRLMYFLTGASFRTATHVKYKYQLLWHHI